MRRHVEAERDYRIGEIAAWHELQKNVAEAQRNYTKNVAEDQHDREYAAENDKDREVRSESREALDRLMEDVR